MRSIVCIALAGFLATTGRAESDTPAKLPQHHEYQRTLRGFLSTLKEADFDHGVVEPITMPAELDDMEELYRNWLMSLDVQPVIVENGG